MSARHRVEVYESARRDLADIAERRLQLVEKALRRARGEVAQGQCRCGDCLACEWAEARARKRAS